MKECGGGAEPLSHLEHRSLYRSPDLQERIGFRWLCCPAGSLQKFYREVDGEVEGIWSRCVCVL